ncbi:Fic family protein [Eggerthella lenta]|uniref:Fic family protein n=1 Tax=Eggerthella lenta TaxID=84112 RepID=UPI000DF7C53B|nr:ATP-binding protein [Eggerthella lenta]RDC17301.1 hypothetical protein C1859_11305 [Eggerthella lenta]
MFEGGRIPDDVLTESIPSLRRNPVLADLFQRMHFMERRGSGLRKICQATMNEDNYEKRFMPRFEERTGFFFVTLWNMNIGVAPQDAQQVRDEKRLEDSLPDNATQQVAQQVSSLLNALGDQELSGRELMDAMRLADRNNFTKNYLNPALEAGLIERTIPDKPRSSKQKYRRSSHS